MSDQFCCGCFQRCQSRPQNMPDSMGGDHWKLYSWTIKSGSLATHSKRMGRSLGDVDRTQLLFTLQTPAERDFQALLVVGQHFFWVYHGRSSYSMIEPYRPYIFQQQLMVSGTGSRQVTLYTRLEAGYNIAVNCWELKKPQKAIVRHIQLVARQWSYRFSGGGASRQRSWNEVEQR